MTIRKASRLLLPVMLSAALHADAQAANTRSTPSDDSCKADASWFPHNKTAMPDGNGFDGRTNCAFHRWAWQTFLWLTKEDANGQPVFLGMQSPYDLLGMKDRESLHPVLNKSQTAHSMDEYLQAGTEGIMIDQNGRAIYSNQYLNDEFVTFIDQNQLTNPEHVQNLNPDTEFPVNAIELKAAWKIVEDGEDTSDFFTMKSSVYKLVNKSGKIVVDSSQKLDVTLAMVGFHIAGVVEGHPEMIWATFEHKDNAPNVQPGTQANDPVADTDSTFYKANTPYHACNINPANSPVLILNETSQTLHPVTQVCRQYAYGNDAAQTNFQVPTNIRVVKELNASVKDNLDKDDVWSNYFEVGAIWFRGANRLKPGMDLAEDYDPDIPADDPKHQLLIGSLKLSNSTIETFTQRANTMDNCFRCHNTQYRLPPSGNPDLQPLKATNLNISHAFMNIYFWSQEQSLNNK
ncbi:MAG: hypothetical protein OIF57_01375 [Marinobacterium sp.]|nr:hypothetical protein [Marinobacterium sp.]